MTWTEKDLTGSSVTAIFTKVSDTEVITRVTLTDAAGKVTKFSPETCVKTSS